MIAVQDCLLETGDHVECVLSWLLRARMSFYEIPLDLPWWFGFFCFSYSLAGAVMLWVEPTWVDKSSYPYRSFAYFLIFLQGIEQMCC